MKVLPPGTLTLAYKGWRIRCRRCQLGQVIEVATDKGKEEVVTELRRRGWERHSKGWTCADCAAQQIANPLM